MDVFHESTICQDLCFLLNEAAASVHHLLALSSILQDLSSMHVLGHTFFEKLRLIALFRMLA